MINFAVGSLNKIEGVCKFFLYKTSEPSRNPTGPWGAYPLHFPTGTSSTLISMIFNPSSLKPGGPLSKMMFSASSGESKAMMWGNPMSSMEGG